MGSFLRFPRKPNIIGNRPFMENFLTRKFGIKTWILQGYKQNQKEKCSIILTLKFNRIKVVKLFKINLLRKKNSFILLTLQYVLVTKGT